MWCDVPHSRIIPYALSQEKWLQDIINAKVKSEKQAKAYHSAFDSNPAVLILRLHHTESQKPHSDSFFPKKEC